MASAAKSLIQTLRRYIKKPWEITGPVADPEYRSAVPKATEYRLFCPATVPLKPSCPLPYQKPFTTSSTSLATSAVTDPNKTHRLEEG
ncbi:UNVERIFIED_CONTAM: hypothetical protein Slati_1602200 [Sesamum latifolium]|uniref:Uncharacterized protein n=1 Tax=Sesamum latifolium TaxID=2727402 RepID=A0AAW2X9I4_9LAMI